jgi:NAD-dependent DNA ligase
VAGVLGKDDIDEEKIKDLTLVPIHVIVDGKHVDLDIVDDYVRDGLILSHRYTMTLYSIDEHSYIEVMKDMEDFRTRCRFQLDGVVFALPVNVREDLSENDHSPNWSLAIKFVPDEAVTEVTGIEWNIGKTGEFTPVVKLKPVELAGTIVKRASGYNAGYIVRNKIKKGTLVCICKRGDIIPAIQYVICTPD